MKGKAKWGLLALAVLCGVAGCGAGERRPSEDAVKRAQRMAMLIKNEQDALIDPGTRPVGADHGLDQRVHPIEAFPGEYLPGGECTRARVFVGKAASAVAFEVRCQGGRRKKGAGFLVARSILPYRGVHTGIIDFERRLKARGVRGGSGHGVCQRIRGELACSAVVMGTVRLSGKLFLTPKTRCKWGVGITTFPASSGEGEEPTGVLITKSLAEGLPNGC
jgi:hypothetical protein